MKNKHVQSIKFKIEMITLGSNWWMVMNTSGTNILLLLAQLLKIVDFCFGQTCYIQFNGRMIMKTTEILLLPVSLSLSLLHLISNSKQSFSVFFYQLHLFPPLNPFCFGKIYKCGGKRSHSEHLSEAMDTNMFHFFESTSFQCGIEIG